MRIYIKIIILLFSLFLQLFTINSVYSNNKKNGNYLYRHYNNIKENIDLVYSITQDSNGYIWIYSNSGLFRFDGNELDKAENMGIENINMLSNISFCTLDGDLKNRVWIRNTQNLYCLNVKDGKLTSHLKEKFNNGLHLYTSSIDDNKLWLGTSEGLILYNPESEMDTTKIYIKDIFALSGRYNNTIWGALQDNRIIKYNVKENNYEIIENTLIKGIPSLIKQINDTIVLIGCKDNGGLWLYNTEKNIFNNLISNTTINCIEPFFNNQFCMATKNGIYVLNPQNNEIELIRKGNIPYLSIPESFVSTIKQDKEGGIWIGTYYQGFSYIPNQPIDLNFYIPEKTDKNLKGNVVMSFCEDKYNNLWVATQDDGVNMFNLKTKEFINYSRNNNEKKILSSNFFNTIAIDDEVWLGSIDLGIEVIDILSGRSIRKYAKGDDANSLNSNIIITFHYSYNKVLYVGTAEGLMQYNKLNDNFTPILPGIIKSTSCIFKDDEFLWVGTWDGLYKIDKNNNFEVYKNIAEDSTSISSSTISSIFKGSDGALYFGTYNGFNVYNKKNNNFTRYYIDKNSPAAVNGMVEDKNGIIWGTSDNGIFYINPINNKVIQYNNLDGAFEKKLNQMPFMASNNKIYFGMHNGFVSFYPNSDYKKNNEYLPKLHISKVLIKNNNNNIDTTIWNNNLLELKYNQNNISIYYSYPTFIYSNNFNLSYQLEGLDDEWIQKSSYSPIEFQNLTDRKYKLHIKVKDLSGIYPNDSVVFSFVIKPPIWKTSFAYLAYAIILSLIFYLIFDFIKKKEKKKAEELKNTIEKEKEIEMYNTKIHFFMAIAHEIRTPLTLINIPLEELTEKYKDDENINKQLNLISKNSKRLSELSAQLLNFKKTDNSNNQLKYTKIDIVSYINELLFMFSSSIKKKGIEIKTLLPSTPIEAHLDKELFTKIISNLINNAIKYSKEYIEIRLSIENNNLHFSFINDGYIIPIEDRENIFTLFYRSPISQHEKGNGIGLSISRQLSQLLGGSLDLIFDIAGMNHFKLVLPLNNTNDNNVEIIGEEDKNTFDIDVDSKRKTILIVEDNKDLREHIANSFKQEYNVIAAYNCSEALGILKNNVISLIISDIVTPGGIDGLQLSRIVKSTINLSHIPIILMSANGNEETKLTGIEYGADVYFEKPFSIKQLYTQVKSLLKGREQIYENLNKKPINPFASIGKNKSDELFFNNFYKLIEKNLSDPNLNMQFLAKKLNISQSSMYKKVKDITDISPNDFIRITRLKKGAALISEGVLSIKEITYLIGYSSPTYFSTCFQRQFGVTPTEYAKSLKESSIKQVNDTNNEPQE